MFGSVCINLKDYTMKKCIGNGAYSKVYLIESKATKKLYAAKKFNNFYFNPETIIQFMQEVEKLINIKYPTIIHFFGYSFKDFKLKPHPIIITNYIPNQSIKEILELGNDPENASSFDISDTIRYIIILGTSLAMKYLHSIGIVHRDLKPANILLNENYYPLICDFGFSKMTNEQLKHFVMDSVLGSPFYMAPEIRNAEGYTYKVDVYSFSLVAYQLINLIDFPFRFDITNINGEENRQFLNRCHSENPLLRPDFNEICLQIVQKRFLSVFSNINIKEVKDFFDFLRKKENNDHAYSLYIYGVFLNENGDEKDKKEMINVFKEAADEGNPNAMFFYAEKLFNGEYVNCNKKEAFKYYKNAANNGNADAMLKCAIMLDEGDEIDKNKEEALFCYKKAADYGNIKAKSILQSKISSFFEDKNDEPFLNEHNSNINEINKQSKVKNNKNESKTTTVLKKKKRCKSIGKCKKKNQINKQENLIYPDDNEPNKLSNNIDVIKKPKVADQSEVKKLNEEKDSKPVFKNKKRSSSTNKRPYQMNRKILKPNPNEEKVSKKSVDKELSENSDEKNSAKNSDDKDLSENSDEEKASKDSDDKKLSENSNDDKYPKQTSKINKSRIVKKSSKTIRKNPKSKKPNKTKLLNKTESPKSSDDSDNDDDKKSTAISNDNDKSTEPFHSKPVFEKKNQASKISKYKKGTSKRSHSVGRFRIIKKSTNHKTKISSSDNSEDSDNNELKSDDEKVKDEDDILNEEEEKLEDRNDKKLEEVHDSKEENESKKDQNDANENSIIEENSIIYILSRKKQNAEVFQSQDEEKEIDIPKSIEHESKIYKVVQISSEAFLNSKIEVFKMISDENLTISQKSFENCNSLKSIMIETTETIHIKDNNFNKIPKLELINIKGKQVFFGSNCFIECFPQHNYLPIQRKQSDEKIIRIEGTNNISIANACFKKLGLLEQIELKSNQIIVGDDCFDECKYLSSFILSESKEFLLGSNQFRKCSNFQGIKLNSAKIQFGTRCFSQSNITNVEILCEKIIIDKFSFSDLSTITEFSINKSSSVIIEEKAFLGCNNLKSFSVISELSVYINNSSFINLNSLQKIYIKCPAIFIGESCFMNCKSLSLIEFDKVHEYIISDTAFSHCESLKKLSLNSHQKAQIKRYSFFDCKNLSSIEFGGEEILLDESCFENCSSLSLSTFSNVNVLDIKSKCFQNCVNLAKIYIGKSGVVHFGSFCFFKALKLASIDIYTDHLITDENCFYQCESLKSLIFDKVKNAFFIPNSFRECSNLQNILIKNACSFNLGETCFVDNQNITSIEIQSEEIKFSNKFINLCPHLTKIKLNSIQNIEITQDIFPECSSLSYIEISSENSIYITEKCFSNSKKLEQVKIKSNKINIDNEGFSFSTNLKYIIIDCTELKIGKGSFMNCLNLSFISLNNIQNAIIDSQAFFGLPKLQSITIKAQSKIFFGDSCFSGAINLEYITIDSKEVELLKNCFRGCKNLSSFALKNVQNAFFGTNSFDQCHKLKNIEISALSNIKLNKFCFYGANNIDSIILRSKEITIDQYCFKDCKYLSNIQLYDVDNLTIGSSAFFGCESLQNINIVVKSNLKICNYCFSGAHNLKNVALSGNYLIIGDFIFKECPSIISATLKSSAGSQLSDNAFNKSPRAFKPDITKLTK